MTIAIGVWRPAQPLLDLRPLAGLDPAIVAEHECRPRGGESTSSVHGMGCAVKMLGRARGTSIE